MDSRRRPTIATQEALELKGPDAGELAKLLLTSTDDLLIKQRHLTQLNWRYWGWFLLKWGSRAALTVEVAAIFIFFKHINDHIKDNSATTIGLESLGNAVVGPIGAYGLYQLSLFAKTKQQSITEEIDRVKEEIHKLHSLELG